MIKKIVNDISSINYSNLDSSSSNNKTVIGNTISDISSDVMDVVHEVGDNNVLRYENSDFEDACNLSRNVIVHDYYQDGVRKNDMDACNRDFVDSLKGTRFENVDGLNKEFKKNIEDAKPGTLNAVIVAAMFLGYVYPSETGRNYFYTNDFGITTRAGVEGRGAGAEGFVVGETNLDCRAFVQWALYNAGYKADELNYIDSTDDGVSVPDIAKVAPVKEDVRTVQPGDIFTTDGNGHIWLVVGTYDDGYYAAEAYGYDNGVVINKYSFDNPYGKYPDAKLYDMSDYYNNPDNIRDEFK